MIKVSATEALGNFKLRAERGAAAQFRFAVGPLRGADGGGDGLRECAGARRAEDRSCTIAIWSRICARRRFSALLEQRAPGAFCFSLARTSIAASWPACTWRPILELLQPSADLRRRAHGRVALRSARRHGGALAGGGGGRLEKHVRTQRYWRAASAAACTLTIAAVAILGAGRRALRGQGVSADQLAEALNAIQWTAFGLCVAALVVIWRKGAFGDSLYLWLGLTLVTMMAGLALSAVSDGPRPSVGWARLAC